MSKRLNKAIQELNIGLQTAIDFLQKHNLLESGAVQPTLKLTEEQFDALVVEFSSDKKERERLKKIKEDKVKEKAPATPVKDDNIDDKPTATMPQLKPLGKIDLDSLAPKTGSKSKAKKKTAKAEPEEETTVVPADVEQAEVPTAPATDDVPSVPASVAEPDTAAEQEAVKADEKPAEDTSVQPVEAEAAGSDSTDIQPSEEPQPTESTAEAGNVEDKKEPEADNASPATAEDNKEEAPKAKTTEIFTLPREQKPKPQVNVLGMLDLSSINTSMRPKKKSKEERRKEREAKAAQANGEKKKRARISNTRVDIKAAGKQAANTPQPATGSGKKKKNKKPQRQLEVNEEDVARQVKETLARLTSKSQNKKGAKYRREKRDAVHERMQQANEELNAENKVLKLTEFVTVSELATMMNVGVTQVIGTCMSVGIMVSINQRLDAETINLVADEFGFTTEYVSAEVQEAITEETDKEEDLVPRAPIVTVMGHVDHGKTSLLDYIRKTNVIAGEAGGITQHIGAYNVELEDGRHITFLDTPGHEAFTAMRARGAQVTDIAIIIIAADDSVMPTTKEAIAHAQAAGVPMVFAINKVDKPGANPEKIREDLANMNLLVEDWGGKYQCQEISAKKGMGINELLEKVLLEAEMLELKANPNRKATGSIIESSLDKGRGYVSTVLVSNGTLHVGDVVVAGTSYGKVKAMFNERNQRISEALPSEPCIILGLNGAPTAGDSFHIMDTEQEAREIANKRTQLQREQALRTTKTLGLDELSHRFALGEFHELNIIVKGDTDGSIEALADSFIKLSTEKVQVNVISKAVGQISENDVMLASASDAIIVGFQVRPSAEARKTAEREGVSINIYSIIYDAIDDIKSTMEGMLDKVKKEVVTGEIEVKQVFKISKVGTVAGGLVIDGKVHNKDKARVIRDGIVVHTANIGALKRYKDDAKEVATGLECGISLQNYNDIQTGDIIETFTEIEVEQKL